MLHVVRTIFNRPLIGFACGGVIIFGILVGASRSPVPAHEALQGVVEIGFPSVAVRTIAPKEKRYHQVSLAEGSLFEVTVEQHGVDIALAIESRDGLSLVGVDKPSGDYGTEHLMWVASYSGDYFLTVSSLEQKRAGSYTLHVRQVRPAATRDRQWVAAQAAIDRGSKQFKAGDLLEAHARYSEAATLWEAADDETARAGALYMAGRVSMELKNFASAELELSQAQKVYRASGDMPMLASTLNELGRAYGELALMPKELAAYKEALALWSDLGDRSQAARTLSYLGRAYQRLGDIDGALVSFDESLAKARQAEDSYQEARALALRSRLLFSLNEFQGASADLERSLELWKELGDRAGIVETLALQVHALKQVGAEGRSRASFLEVMRVLHSLSSGLADLPLSKKNSEMTIELAAAMGDITEETAAKFYLSQAERGRGNLEDARRSLEAAIFDVENPATKHSIVPSQRSWLAIRRVLYESYIEILMELHGRNPTSGFDVLAFLSSERSRRRDMITASGIEGVKQSSFPNVERLPSRVPLSLGEIQRRFLAPGDLLLYYGWGEESTFLWTVTSTHFRAYTLADRARIETLARDSFDILSASYRPSQSGRTQLALLTLGDLLLAPVADQLPSRRLIIVTDGALSSIPFGALPAPGSNQPLLAQTEVVVVPSSALTEPLRRRHANAPKPSKTIAVIADPVFEAGDPRLSGSGMARLASNSTQAGAGILGERREVRLARLPFTGKEAETILGFVSPSQRLGLLGFSANRQSVLDGRLSDYKILHFATHAMKDEQGYSLVLSRYDEQGRSLRSLVSAAEISQLKLSADLVVLSACQTGLGSQTGGSGLVGLTQGFLSAGASRTLVSLWAIDDQSTQVFMDRFYQYLLVEGHPPSESLRQAQIWMSRHSPWSSPYYWAGFILVGEWQ